MFPKYPKVSRLCRSLIIRILVPQFARLRINSIKNDAWLETSVVAQTSISDRFIVRINPCNLLSMSEFKMAKSYVCRANEHNWFLFVDPIMFNCLVNLTALST